MRPEVVDSAGHSTWTQENLVCFFLLLPKIWESVSWRDSDYSGMEGRAKLWTGNHRGHLPAVSKDGSQSSHAVSFIWEVFSRICRVLLGTGKRHKSQEGTMHPVYREGIMWLLWTSCIVMGIQDAAFISWVYLKAVLWGNQYRAGGQFKLLDKTDASRGALSVLDP